VFFNGRQWLKRVISICRVDPVDRLIFIRVDHFEEPGRAAGVAVCRELRLFSAISVAGRLRLAFASVTNRALPLPHRRVEQVDGAVRVALPRRDGFRAVGSTRY
jgi:hypothetical protein